MNNRAKKKNSVIISVKTMLQFLIGFIVIPVFVSGQNAKNEKSKRYKYKVLNRRTLIVNLKIVNY